MKKTLISTSINQENFEDYFQKSINDLFHKNNLSNISNYAYDELNNLSHKELKNNREELNVILACYNLFNDIQYVNNKETDYYKYIEKNFINGLLEKPIYYALVLSFLLDGNLVKNSFFEIYKKKNVNVKKENITIETLISNENSDVFYEYLDFLQRYLEVTDEIVAGIYELAKNVVEHSEKREGRISIKTISEDSLRNIRLSYRSIDERSILNFRKIEIVVGYLIPVQTGLPAFCRKNSMQQVRRGD